MPSKYDQIVSEKNQSKANKRKSERTIDFGKLYQNFGFDTPVEKTGEICVDCPECGKLKLHINLDLGLYDCKTCDFEGNHWTLLRWYFDWCLEETTHDNYRDLSTNRGIPTQTLRRHGLAFDSDKDAWLIPFHDTKDEVINFQLYYPNRHGKNKFNLPGLKTDLYGLNRLSKVRERLVFLCEAPFDAMALDYKIGNKNRGKYDILALPGSCYSTLASHLKGRNVRTVFDNDSGGQRHRQATNKYLGQVVSKLAHFHWPDGYPAGYDINDLIRDEPDTKIIGWTQSHARKYVATESLNFRSGTEIMSSDEYQRPTVFIWENRIPTGTYISLTGYQGSCKSTFTRDLAARVTTGRPMPDGTPVGITSKDVIYITAEDSKEVVVTSFLDHDGNPDNLHAIGLQIKEGEDATLNLIDDLPAIENKILELDCKLVIVDGQNSLLGDADYSSDAKARCNITNKLVALAQRTGVALIGIRNETRDGTKLGAASMADISRCVIRTKVLKPDGKMVDGKWIETPQKFPIELQFEKISSSPAQTSMKLRPKDLGKDGNNRNRMRLEWEDEATAKSLGKKIPKKKVTKKKVTKKNRRKKPPK